jgi:hypothetical protein
MLAAVVVVAAVVLWPDGKKSAEVPAAAPPAAGTNPVQAAGQTSFAKLVGKWLRPDGGYVFDVRMVSSEGKIDCAYLNPSPINVSRAEASRDGSSLKVFIELRDVNYPGCTYTLLYDPQRDGMKGVYYQAALQQSFDVEFIRLPAEQH